jgi:hypothetical protein
MRAFSGHARRNRDATDDRAERVDRRLLRKAR